LRWFSDQFCSLVFTLSNLYFTFCAYVHNFQPSVWETCGTQSQNGWLVAFVLAMLPLLVRLIQSVRRYSDSKLVTHLINVSQCCPPWYVLKRKVVLTTSQSLFAGRKVRLRDNLLLLLLSLAAPRCVQPWAYAYTIYHTATSGVTNRGGSFVLWCLSGAMYSIYACTWVGSLRILQI
jgi:hypothetical protein